MTGLGIDDFALRRADSYGTILVNLETRRPLDLLPDRTAEAVKPWLATHLEIQVVSRDRASAFADAVNQVLPHATQVADRYHLIQNLREHRKPPPGSQTLLFAVGRGYGGEKFADER